LIDFLSSHWKNAVYDDAMMLEKQLYHYKNKLHFKI